MSNPLLFAGTEETIPWLIGLVLGVAVVFFSFVLMLSSRYKRCPSNRILVIYGKVGGGNTARCIHGGAAFVLPLIQDHAYLNLEPHQIEIPLKGALSAENIRVNVPSVFTVAIGTDPEIMQNAAIRLLGLNIQEIKQQAGDIIFGQLRQVIASMRIEEINRDREKFLQSIQTSLEPELRKIGLVLINVNITDITDESGYIEAIGRKAAAEAVQKAKVAVAEQEKLGQIGIAEAEREKAISVANAVKLRQIGTREAEREQAVRLAQLTKEQKVGEETAAFEREAQIKEVQRQQAVRVANLDKEQKVGEQTAAFQKEAQVKAAERDMRVALADANAKAVAGEAQAQAEIALTQASLQVKQAEAYQLGETRKREAEAAVQQAQNRALAKAALAQAERVEAERRAAVEAPAKAEKARILVEAEAEAEKRRIEAEGQAKAIFAKLEAEAKGQYEVLAKKAEGLRQIIEACGGAPQAFQMLMLEHLDALAQASARAISGIKFDKVVVWENGGGNGQGTTSTAHFLQNLARVMPPMMQVMKDVGGVEMPEFLARLTPEAGPRNAAVPEAAPRGEPNGHARPLGPRRVRGRRTGGGRGAAVRASAMRAYRWVFALAAAYNVAFGTWAGLFPHSFFTLFDLPPPRYPSIWACLGMVVVVYALAYAYVAFDPGRGTPFVAVGLLGKALGPAGWLAAVASGELPPRTFPLILANDLVWWFPFLCYLVRGLPARRTIVAWAGVAVHVLACLALLAAADGTEIVPEKADRLRWVGEHPGLWAATWACWALASMSLIAFTVLWTTALVERGGRRGWAALGCLVVALGLPFDLVGESVNLMWPTRPGLTVAEFARGARLYAILSAGIANGLYCAGGLVLSAVSWHAGWLRGGAGLLGVAMWAVGLALTLTAVLDHGPGMIVTGAGVMALYIPWAAVVGWGLSR
jgi:flotillin